jgi:predicted ATPase
VRKYVITGAAHCGKSTLLKQIWAEFSDYCYTLDDVASTIIAKHKTQDSNALPWKDIVKFQKEVLALQLTWEKEQPDSDKMSFQDRGVYDGIAYLLVEKKDIPQEFFSFERRPYEKIFILDRLLDIEKKAVKSKSAEKDAVEKEAAIAQAIDSKIEQVYRQYGYPVVRVPAYGIKERCMFLFNHL